MSRGTYGPPQDDEFDDEDDFTFDEEFEEEARPTPPGFSTRSSNVSQRVNRFGLPPTDRGSLQADAEKSAERRNPTQRRSTKTTVKQRGGKLVLPIEDVKMAAMQNNTTLLRQFVEQGYPVDTLIHSDWTALMYAAHYGNHETVTYLLEAGANARYHKDMYSVLMAACSATCNNEDDVINCVTALVDAGADINAFDRHHLSPIIYAAREGRAKLIRELVARGSDMNKQDSRGYSALMWAVSRKKLHAVYVLIELGCDVTKRDRYGSTALDLATIDGHKQIEQLLRNKNKAGGEKLILSESDLKEREGISSTGDSSGDATMRYGDLEMVLSGLGLNELIPVFHKHHISFEQFLRMTDSDLQQVVPQTGVRKKLLENIAKLHKKEWEATSVSSAGALQAKQLTCAEAIFMMQNIKKHASYIASSTAYIREHMRAPVLRLAQEGAGAEQLSIHTTEAWTNAQLLVKELGDLREHLCVMTSQPEALPPDLIQSTTATADASARPRLLVKCFLTVSLIGLVIFKRHTVYSQIFKIFDFVTSPSVSKIG